MPGLDRLSSITTALYFQGELSDSSYEFNGNQFYVSGEDPNRVIVMPTLDATSLLEFIKAIRNCNPQSKYQDIRTLPMIVGVVGNGATERHIVSHYIPKSNISEQNPILALDSKVTQLESFYKHQETIGFFQKIANGARSLVQALQSFPEQHHVLDGYYIRSVSLGTQSALDGVSCGYHHINTTRLLENFIVSEARTQDNIVELVTDKRALSSLTVVGGYHRQSLLSKIDGEQNAFSENSIQTMFASWNPNAGLHYQKFMKAAWQRIFPNSLMEDGSHASLSHYFIGWPKQEESTGKKALYFLTLGFITTPLVNLVKAAIQWPVNWLHGTMQYFHHRLMATSPRSLGMQYLRTMAMAFTGLTQFIMNATAKVVNFSVDAVVSPIENAKKHWKHNKLLGIASALISLGIIGALAVFAAPILVSALPASVGSGVSTIALANIPTLSSVSTASAMLAAGASVLGFMKLGVSKLLNCFSTKKPASTPAQTGSDSTRGMLSGLGHSQSQEDDGWTSVDSDKKEHGDAFFAQPKAGSSSQTDDIRSESSFPII